MLLMTLEMVVLLLFKAQRRGTVWVVEVQKVVQAQTAHPRLELQGVLPNTVVVAAGAVV
jgi:hypothetical protein